MSQREPRPLSLAGLFCSPTLHHHPPQENPKTGRAPTRSFLVNIGVQTNRRRQDIHEERAPARSRPTARTFLPSADLPAKRDRHAHIYEESQEQSPGGNGALDQGARKDWA